MTKVLIAGGSGLLGKRLATYLEKQGYEVAMLSRDPRRTGRFQGYAWNPEAGTIDEVAFMGADILINLAGEGIVDKAWTQARKKALRDSRVLSNQLLASALQTYPHQIKHFISASAVGYYGLQSERPKAETDAPGSDFMAQLCVDWEKAAAQVTALNIPTTILRIGIILDEKGGFIPEFSRPIRTGFGAPLGSGKQRISWIHYQDMVRIVAWVIEKKLYGVYNAAATNPVSNADMTQAIAKTLEKPCWLPAVPGWALGLMLGERKDALLADMNVSVSKLLQTGFQFEHEQLMPALRSLFQDE